MIVILVLMPVAIVMSGAVLAGIIGTVLHRDRDAAYEGTEHLAIANADSAPAR